MNYYLERGFNMDSSRNNGEFSTQEIRAYLPISLGNTTLTPYTRRGSTAGQTGTGKTILSVKGMISTVWACFMPTISITVFQ